GIQRRNGGACWSPQITDFDLDKIALLSGLEELNLGIGLSLGRPSSSGAVGNCRVAGGITITGLGVEKLSKLKNLRWLEISGAQITSAGLKSLQSMPRLERLSLWNCKAIDDAAAPLLAAIPSLSNLDLSNTSVGNQTLQALAALPSLKLLYLTETNVTPEGLAAFHKQKPAVFVSWAGGTSK
ncbi:MAG TPA: hypothetical protein VM120_10630, partial [Bryobacteraceae bacterium]|nr:hypothetical protein [Bryobacteraceae bacterium]